MKQQVLRHLMCSTGKKLAEKAAYSHARKEILQIVSSLSVEYSRGTGYLLRYELNGHTRSTSVSGDQFVFHKRGDTPKTFIQSESGLDLETTNRARALEIWGQLLGLNVILNESPTSHKRRAFVFSDYLYFAWFLGSTLVLISLEPDAINSKTHLIVYLLLLGVSAFESKKENLFVSVIGFVLLAAITIIKPALFLWVICVLIFETVFQLFRRSIRRALAGLLCIFLVTGLVIQKVASGLISAEPSFFTFSFLLTSGLTVTCIAFVALFGRVASTLHWSALLVGVGIASLGVTDLLEFFMILSAPLIVLLKVSSPIQNTVYQRTTEMVSMDRAVPVVLRRVQKN